MLNLFRRSYATPWYAAGLSFTCRRCGRCCAGPEEGYVWVTGDEIVAMAKAIDETPGDFRNKYTRNVGSRISLREDAKKDCVFLARDEQGLSLCRLYECRPMQCRTWPFWPGNLATAENWCHAQQRCPGINQGQIVSLEDIELRRDKVSP
jgi:Fe-S-cluster containining protein